MKRFYREAAVAETADGHGVVLDGRPVRTPGRQPMVAPSPGLAEAIAEEWRAQGQEIQPAAMPLTRLATTALDRMPAQRRPAIEEIIAYAGTDLLCYRAAEPFELVQRQQRVWQPWLDWAAERYGVRLRVTADIQPLSQPEEAVAPLRARVEGLGDWSLVGLHAATTALGSVILGLALLDARIDAGAALEISLLDELFEIERWGWDSESERRHAVLRRDVGAAEVFLARLREAHGTSPD